MTYLLIAIALACFYALIQVAVDWDEPEDESTAAVTTRSAPAQAAQDRLDMLCSSSWSVLVVFVVFVALGAWAVAYDGVVSEDLADITVRDTGLPRSVGVQTAIAQMWATSALSMIAGIAAVAAILGAILHRAHVCRESASSLVTVALVVIVPVGVAVYLTMNGFDSLMSPAWDPILREVPEHTSAWLTNFEHLERYAAILYAGLIGAMAATLVYHTPSATGGTDAVADDLARQHWTLDTVLLAASFALASATLNAGGATGVLLALMPSMGAGAATLADYESLARIQGLCYGVFYSSCLIAAYVPAAVIVRLRMRALGSVATEGAGLVATDNWLAKNGFGRPLMGDGARLLIALGPVIAGGFLLPLTGLLSTS